MKTVEERFWDSVVKGDGCWSWDKALDAFGYGTLRESSPSRKMIRAHRLSWILHNGPIPVGMYVCHTCDIPSCSNPAHLFLGTAKDNTQDGIRKNRIITCLKGEKCSNAKLTLIQVEEIRKKYHAGNSFQYVLAAEYGVSQATVSLIVNKINWK